MGEAQQLLVWSWYGQYYGLPILNVDRVVQMVEIRPFLDPAPNLLGIINVQGEVIPVFFFGACSNGRDSDTPTRNGCQPEVDAGRPPEIRINQQLVLARSKKGPMALIADEITGLMSASEEQLVSPDKILPNVSGIEGVFKAPLGLVLLPKLEFILSRAESLPKSQPPGKKEEA